MRNLHTAFVGGLVLVIIFPIIAHAKGGAAISGALWGGYNSNIYNSSFAPTGAYFLSPSVAAGFGDGGFYLQGDLHPQIHLDSGSPGGLNTLVQTGYRFSLFDNFWDWELEYGFSLSQGIGDSPTIASSKVHRFSLTQSLLFEYLSPEFSLDYRRADYSDLGHTDDVLSLGSGLVLFLSDSISLNVGGGWEEVKSSLLMYQYRGPMYSVGTVLDLSTSTQFTGGVQIGRFVYAESSRVDNNQFLQFGLSSKIGNKTEIGIKLIRTLNSSSFADYSYANTTVRSGISWGF